MSEHSAVLSELAEIVSHLPNFLTPDDIHPTPVMRDWTTYLPLRHQGVLVTAIRGCDGADKNDKSKCLTSMVRRAILNPADKRETTAARGFFGFSAERVNEELPDFLRSLDQYPMHYVLHLMHACEVIGYYHPNMVMRQFFMWTYKRMVKSLHLNPETKDQLDERLTCDRVAAGTVERDF